MIKNNYTQMYRKVWEDVPEFKGKALKTILQKKISIRILLPYYFKVGCGVSQMIPPKLTARTAVKYFMLIGYHFLNTLPL